MKFDDVLEEVGQFGKYQKWVYFLLCLTAITCGFHAYIPVYVLDTPDFRCALPDYPNDTFEIQNDYHRSLINRSIPMKYDDYEWKYETCLIANLSGLISNSSNSSSFPNIKCNSYVYDRSEMHETYVTEMDVVCDNKVKRTHIKSIYMVGKLFGAIGFGMLADIIGRKKVLLLSCLIQLLSGVANAYITNYIGFGVCRLFNGASSSGLFSSAFVIGLELVGPTKRVWVGMVIEFFYAAGGLILVLVSYLLRDWSLVQMSLSVPSALFVVYWWLMPESPRWLISKGRKEEAMTILVKLARVNGTTLPDKADVIDDNEQIPQAKPWQLCFSRSLACRLAIVFINWGVVSGVFYGLSYNAGELYGNIFISYFLNALVEFPAYAVCLAILDRVGRIRLHTSMMIVGGVANLCTIFTVLYGGRGLRWMTTALALIGKFGASAAFATIYIFTAEMFPTIMRNGVLGSSSFCARIGGIICPYIADLAYLIKTDFGKALPLVIFGAASVTAGLLALHLPETLNKALPDTIDDAKNISKSRWRRKGNKYAVTEQPLYNGDALVNGDGDVGANNVELSKINGDPSNV